MKIISLALGVAQKEKPGSFGAELHDSTLYLPVKLYRFTQEIDWRSAAQFFLGTLDFPQTLQDILGWSPAECKQASEELGKLLRGHLPDDVLDLPEMEHHPRGALPPDTD